MKIAESNSARDSNSQLSESLRSSSHKTVNSLLQHELDQQQKPHLLCKKWIFAMPQYIVKKCNNRRYRRRFYFLITLSHTSSIFILKTENLIQQISHLKKHSNFTFMSFLKISDVQDLMTSPQETRQCHPIYNILFLIPD